MIKLINIYCEIAFFIIEPDSEYCFIFDHNSKSFFHTLVQPLWTMEGPFYEYNSLLSAWKHMHNLKCSRFALLPNNHEKFIFKYTHEFSSDTRLEWNILLDKDEKRVINKKVGVHKTKLVVSSFGIYNFCTFYIFCRLLLVDR